MFLRTGAYKPERKRTLKEVNVEHVEEIFEMLRNDCTIYYSEIISNLEVAFDITYTEAQIRLVIEKAGWLHSKVHIDAAEQNVFERAAWRDSITACFSGNYN